MLRQIKIKVIPRSSKNEIINELPDGTLKIKLTAPPVNGEANKQLIEFLSGKWKVAKSKIRIVRGGTNQKKVIEIIGKDWIKNCEKP